MPESEGYAQKKARYSKMLTVYGRKPALEVLQDDSVRCHALHLADNNREGGIIAQLIAQAELRGVTVKHHSRAELARISKNGKQDQGVALDVHCPAFLDADQYLASAAARAAGTRLLALDGISNPANLGMIIRSAAAGAIDGIICPRRGNAALGPLVIKASAGTLYRAPLLRCESLADALQLCREGSIEICILAADARESLFDYRPSGSVVYVLGNETDGVSPAVEALADTRLAIPMRNGVESLNVAVTASLIAFTPALGGAGSTLS